MQPDNPHATPHPCPRCGAPVLTDLWTGEPITETGSIGPQTLYGWHRCAPDGVAAAARQVTAATHSQPRPGNGTAPRLAPRAVNGVADWLHAGRVHRKLGRG